MWAGYEKDKRIKEHTEQREKVEVIFEIIHNHFGGELDNYWTEIAFNPRILYYIGPDILLKYGQCEYCENYVGVSAVRRKANKKLSVLSAYCIDRSIAIKPTSKCPKWAAKSYYKNIIIKQIAKEMKAKDQGYSHGLIGEENDY